MPPHLIDLAATMFLREAFPIQNTPGLSLSVVPKLLVAEWKPLCYCGIYISIHLVHTSSSWQSKV